MKSHLVILLTKIEVYTDGIYDDKWLYIYIYIYDMNGPFIDDFLIKDD